MLSFRFTYGDYTAKSNNAKLWLIYHRRLHNFIWYIISLFHLFYKNVTWSAKAIPPVLWDSSPGELQCSSISYVKTMHTCAVTVHRFMVPLGHIDYIKVLKAVNLRIHSYQDSAAKFSLSARCLKGGPYRAWNFTVGRTRGVDTCSTVYANVKYSWFMYILFTYGFDLSFIDRS
jgi:hypothetical protein